MPISNGEVFQSLKGVLYPRVSGFSLNLGSTGYGLFPISCVECELDDATVAMLTEGRNANPQSFLTFFTATNKRTKNWLVNGIGRDSNRILFAIKSYKTNRPYGYAGLIANGIEHDCIEADAIVRYQSQRIKGLMNAALLKLVFWSLNDLKRKEVVVRVLSDNPAVEFYRACGFRDMKISPLFEERDRKGCLIALRENSENGSLKPSRKTLSHLVFKSVEIKS
jgi:hypothetical protein